MLVFDRKIARKPNTTASLPKIQQNRKSRISLKIGIKKPAREAKNKTARSGHAMPCRQTWMRIGLQ